MKMNDKGLMSNNKTWIGYIEVVLPVICREDGNYFSVTLDTQHVQANDPNIAFKMLKNKIHKAAERFTK